MESKPAHPTITTQTSAQQQAPPAQRAPRAGENASPMTEEQIQNLRDQIQAATREATRAQIAGGDQGGPYTVRPPHQITVRGPDGTETVVGVPSDFAKNMIPPQAVDISIAFFVMVAAIIIGLPLARAFARRMDRSATKAQVSPELSGQLAQLNQAVDAIALEVERISEGQRYTTRLLSEQREPARQTLPARSDG
jgi:outer membrane murein-binding lipoprotein Lpp